MLISCKMSAIGNSTARKSGVTGSSVPGCSTGCGGVGMSALMLYHASGSLLSSNKNFVCSVMIVLLS